MCHEFEFNIHDCSVNQYPPPTDRPGVVSRSTGRIAGKLIALKGRTVLRILNEVSKSKSELFTLIFNQCM